MVVNFFVNVAILKTTEVKSIEIIIEKKKPNKKTREILQLLSTLISTLTLKYIIAYTVIP